MMLWKKAAQVAAAAALILAVAAPAWAAGLGFSATAGLEITYTPHPPASYNIESDLELAFEITGFALQSQTGFDLSGFTHERVSFAVDLGPVEILEDIRFEPEFDWNELSLDVSIVGVNMGADWIFANTGTQQTPSYSMGAVVTLQGEIPVGLSIASVTGFGATNLVNVLGGAAAPLSNSMLALFNHIAAVCSAPTDLRVTVVDGFFFEEELVRLELNAWGVLASNTVWFDDAGLSQIVGELGYRFADPSLGLLTSLTLDGGLGIVDVGVILDLSIDAIRFTSWTGFARPAFPVPVPVLFGGQKFGLQFELCGVTVTGETDFDDLFLFSAQEVAIEATVDPVTFVSLTTFDSGGFSSQCIDASVAFTGVRLSTEAKFTWSGVTLVSFGFELSF
jgi:hypothetical protein